MLCTKVLRITAAPPAVKPIKILNRYSLRVWPLCNQVLLDRLNFCQEEGSESAAMVNYAREHQLSVTTYCPFVKARFQADEAQYTDIWKKGQPQLKFL